MDTLLISIQKSCFRTWTSPTSIKQKCWRLEIDYFLVLDGCKLSVFFDIPYLMSKILCFAHLSRCAHPTSTPLSRATLEDVDVVLVLVTLLLVEVVPVTEVVVKLVVEVVDDVVELLLEVVLVEDDVEELLVELPQFTEAETQWR